MDQFLRATLKAAIPNVSIDWGYNAQGIRPPRIVMYRVSGSPFYTMDGESGLSQTRVQIDCYDTTQAKAKALASSVRAALSGLRTGVISGAFLDAERDAAREQEGGGFIARVSMDFIIYYQDN